MSLAEVSLQDGQKVQCDAPGGLWRAACPVHSRPRSFWRVSPARGAGCCRTWRISAGSRVSDRPHVRPQRWPAGWRCMSVQVARCGRALSVRWPCPRQDPAGVGIAHILDATPLVPPMMVQVHRSIRPCPRASALFQACPPPAPQLGTPHLPRRPGISDRAARTQLSGCRLARGGQHHLPQRGLLIRQRLQLDPQDNQNQGCRAPPFRTPPTRARTISWCRR